MVAQVSIDARLTGLMPALSARERAILILGAFKNKTQEDPRWRSSMPSDQAFELHRLIGLINACGVQLGHLVTFLEGEVETLELRVVHLIMLRDWELNLAEIDYAAAHLVREPMTETAYQDLVKKASLEYVPLAKLAETLALEERAWADDDLEQLRWAGDRVVKPEAWRRLVGGAAARLLAAASAGDLEAKGSGKALRIKRASFDAWLGRAVTPYPDWARGYDIRRRGCPLGGGSKDPRTPPARAGEAPQAFGRTSGPVGGNRRTNCTDPGGHADALGRRPSAGDRYR